MKLIALAGPAGSGKTTLARLLYRTHGYERTSFAEPIKQMLNTLLALQGVPDDRRMEMLYGAQKEMPTALLGSRTPRYAMQTLGSEWRDLMCRNLWLNAWTEQTRNMPKVSVDDLRFTHEAERIHALGGKVFLVLRPQALQADSHISEQEWKTIAYDGVVDNSGTPEEALARLEALL